MHTCTLFFLNYDVLLSLNVVLILANGADPAEMHLAKSTCLGVSSMANTTFELLMESFLLILSVH